MKYRIKEVSRLYGDGRNTTFYYVQFRPSFFPIWLTRNYFWSTKRSAEECIMRLQREKIVKTETRIVS